ncbi:MAG: TPM domain-containing protein [Campylobacterales bacterium]
MRALLFMNFFIACSYAQSAVLRHDGLMMEKSIQKIDEMATEVLQKTGIHLYVIAVNDLNGSNIHTLHKIYEANMTSPYVAILLAKNDQKVDIVATPDVASLIDKDKILDDYMIPILVSPNKEDKEKSYGAAIFNGMSELVDEIAAAKGVTFISSPGSGSHDFIQIVRFVFYFMLFFTLYLFVAKSYERRRVRVEK